MATWSPEPVVPLPVAPLIRHPRGPAANADVAAVADSSPATRPTVAIIDARRRGARREVVDPPMGVYLRIGLGRFRHWPSTTKWRPRRDAAPVEPPPECHASLPTECARPSAELIPPSCGALRFAGWPSAGDASMRAWRKCPTAGREHSRMRSCPPRLNGSALREDDQAEPRHVLGSPRSGTSPGISPQHALQCQLLGVGLAARDDRCAHAWSREGVSNSHDLRSPDSASRPRGPDSSGVVRVVLTEAGRWTDWRGRIRAACYRDVHRRSAPVRPVRVPSSAPRSL